MFYIKDKEQIVLADEVKQNIVNTLKFQPQYKDLPILETKENETIVDFQLMTIDEAKAKEEQEEKERIAKLHLTKREVFLGLRKAKNVLPEQIRAQITDPDSLIEFDYATEYYRGNPLIDLVGEQLGISSKQLDKFFETNDYLYLTDCTLIINPTPVEAIVRINDVEQNSIKVPFETEVKYSVETQGYETVEDKLVISEDTTLDIALKVMPVEVPTEKVPKTSKKTKKA